MPRCGVNRIRRWARKQQLEIIWQFVHYINQEFLIFAHAKFRNENQHQIFWRKLR